MARTVISIGNDPIRLVQAQCYITAYEHGFHEKPGSDIDQKLLLAVGELVEAQNELRSGHKPTDLYFEPATDDGMPQKPAGFGVELADTVIRIFDLAQDNGIDLQSLIELKMNYNELRPHKHGKQF